MTKLNQLFSILKKQSASLWPKSIIVNTVTNFFLFRQTERETNQKTQTNAQRHAGGYRLHSGRTIDLLLASILTTD